MTARHQIRVGGRRLGRDRSPIDATPAPTVGELLQAARQKKGVDLYRAERDTKIRARHLAALEGGDYGELPGAVYTKGFLRNYALYLGLDPDELVAKWRDEQDLARQAETVVVVAPPQPLTEPGRGLTFTPGLVIAAILTVVVLLFAGYVGLQLVRFSQAVTVTLDRSPRIDLPRDSATVTLTGTSIAGAIINVSDGAGQALKTTRADDSGRWTLVLGVSKGRNDFTIVARDADTNRESEPFNVIVTVPVPATPTPRPTPTPTGGPSAPAVVIGPDGQTPAPDEGTPQPGDTTPPTDGATPAPAAQLTITSPADHAAVNGANLRVSGTTDAASVRVTATWFGRAGEPAANPPSGGPKAPAVIGAGAGRGNFSTPLVLPAGWWEITVTTRATGSLASTSQSRTVDVGYNGVVVVVEARGGSAWMKVWADGEVVDEGHTFHNRETETFTAKRTVVVSTGNESATFLTVNGEPFGPLGTKATVGAWVIDKGKDPVPLP